MGNMERFLVKATAKKIFRKKILFRVMAAITAISVTSLLAFYTTVTFASNVGNFTINVVDKGDVRQIALAYDPKFTEARTVLVCDRLREMDNITEGWLPEDIDQIDGNHNGTNYIATTFYLKNFGNVPLDYNRSIEISEVKKGADEAIRVKLYKNGEATVYAKPQKGTVVPEKGTQAFYSTSIVMKEKRKMLEAGFYDKYTLVVWLEGNDPECIDNIKSGNVKFTMNFEIV